MLAISSISIFDGNEILMILVDLRLKVLTVQIFLNYAEKFHDLKTVNNLTCFARAMAAY